MKKKKIKSISEKQKFEINPLLIEKWDMNEKPTRQELIWNLNLFYEWYIEEMNENNKYAKTHCLILNRVVNYFNEVSKQNPQKPTYEQMEKTLLDLRRIMWRTI